MHEKRGQGQREASIDSQIEHRVRTRKNDAAVLEYEVKRWHAVVDLGILGGNRQRKYVSGRTRRRLRESWGSGFTTWTAIARLR